ncbi:hypothetical protein DERF_006358 [Dermatophagoides farinae]|uniref:Uncharacterized protein n=1 Tax=Dermatophagoides farinae TaxID=6954 RepID=A0A922IBG0_DERFA|nr:hypothetical protein DERF_006358 [Dermatophagoides farinae]
MPGGDWIPVLSQMKSFVQVITGDVEGARQTQENFSRECPIVSQARSVVELASGNEEAAIETQSRCLTTMNDFVDGVPIVGHVKGGLHHLIGDHEGGDRALNAASRISVNRKPQQKIFYFSDGGARAVAAVTTEGLKLDNNMPGYDWIPVVSQVKSLVQVITGDVEGARQTQANFSRECPIVSQTRSAIELASGDKETAKKTQYQCLGTMSNFVDFLPIVGHFKGGIQHLTGDHEEGNHALKAATRTSVMMGAGAVATIFTGGLTAILAGIAVGAAFDSSDSIIHNEPRGLFAAVDKAVNKPTGGNVFDAAMGVVGYGMAGYSGSKIGTKMPDNNQVVELGSKMAADIHKLNAVIGLALTFGKEITSLNSKINTITWKKS